MNNKVNKIIKVVIILCLLVLIGDLIFFGYIKNKRDKNKTFFASLNSIVRYKDNYFGVGSNNINNKSLERATLIKYNSNYKEIWKSSLDTKYNSTYFNIKKDGDYLLAVGSYEKTKEENEESLRTALFVKYDNKGKVIFKKTLQILGNSKFTNVLVVSDGYIVVGQSIYPNDILGNEKTGGAIIVKYSKDGKVLWQKNVGGNKSGLFNDVIKSGNYLYAVGKDATRYGMVAKYSLDGEQIKVVSYAKTDTLGFSSIVKSGNYFICVGAKKVNENDEYDHDINGLIVKYDADLEKVDEKVYTENKNGLERFNKVIVDSNKNIIAIGHEAIIDKKKSTKKKNVYYYKSFIVKYNSDLKKLKEKVYHNGIDDYFTTVMEINHIYVIGGYEKYNSNHYKPIFVGYGKELK